MPDRKYRQKGYQDTGSRAPGQGSGPSDERPARLEGAPKGRGAERNRDEVFRCKRCGEKNDPEVAYQARCRKCAAALHACVQCRSFDTSAPFQCRKGINVPQKSNPNDCAAFEPSVSLDLTGTKAADTPDQARAAFDKLFGKR